MTVNLQADVDAADMLDPVTLRGKLAQLEPLDLSQHDDLVTAVSDGKLWELWYTSAPTPEAMATEIDRRLTLHGQRRMLPFVIRDVKHDTLVGMTTYLNIDEANRRLEIGATWLAASSQRTGINTECKLLLLSHAFETLGCIAVEFRTHWMNRQSRTAIERLGAKLDGVLRSHQVMPDGSLRDTVVYSITASEWPAIKSGLSHKLNRAGG